MKQMKTIFYYAFSTEDYNIWSVKLHCAVVRVGMATEVKQNLGTLYNPLN